MARIIHRPNGPEFDSVLVWRELCVCISLTSMKRGERPDTAEERDLARLVKWADDIITRVVAEIEDESSRVFLLEDRLNELESIQGLTVRYYNNKSTVARVMRDNEEGGYALLDEAGPMIRMSGTQWPPEPTSAPLLLDRGLLLIRNGNEGRVTARLIAMLQQSMTIHATMPLVMLTEGMEMPPEGQHGWVRIAHSPYYAWATPQAMFLLNARLYGIEALVTEEQLYQFTFALDEVATHRPSDQWITSLGAGRVGLIAGPLRRLGVPPAMARAAGRLPGALYPGWGLQWTTLADEVDARHTVLVLAFLVDYARTMHMPLVMSQTLEADVRARLTSVVQAGVDPYVRLLGRPVPSWVDVGQGRLVFVPQPMHGGERDVPPALAEDDRPDKRPRLQCRCCGREQEDTTALLTDGLWVYCAKCI